MKKIVNLLLTTCILFFYNISNAGFIICDSGNIDLNGNNESEICNGGFESKNINDIETFTGKYIEYNLGYLGNNNNHIKKLNIIENLPKGFFDNNKKTIVNKINPNYDNQVGFIGIKNTDKSKLNTEENLPKGFFDISKKTVINNVNPNFTFPIGFLKTNNYPIISIKKKKEKTKIYQKRIDVTYKDYFINIFIRYAKTRYKKGGYIHYEDSEYEQLVNNLIYLLGNGFNDYNNIISQNSKNRIEWYIKNNPNFIDNLSSLTLNLREINYSFEKADNNLQKMYLIKYYLNSN